MKKYNGYTSKNNWMYKSYSMSYNAANAYNYGYKPKSKWTKKTMLESLQEWLEIESDYNENIITASIAIFRKWKKDKIFGLLFDYKESHHTGKFYNLTDFYGIDEDTLINTIDLMIEGETTL